MNLLRTWLTSPLPASRLLRQVLLFAAVDVLFLSFAMAFAFTQYGLQGALLYLAAQYALSAAGFLGAFWRMQAEQHSASKVFRWGIGGMLVGLLAGGAVSSPAASLACLALAGFGRGMAWASRQWMEMHHTKGASREAYLALFQSVMTVFKLVGPLAAAGLLYVSHEDFHPLFLVIGATGLVVLLVLGRGEALETPAPGRPRPWQTLCSPEYWKTAPFYLLEGAGAALRQALFVSGTMTVVASVSAYGVLDAMASLAAAGCLAWLARHPAPGPSLRRLQVSLAIVGVSWLLLLGALHLPYLLVGFVATYAFGTPLLMTVKASLVLKGLSSAGSAAHDNAMARELLLAVARLVALGLAAILASSVVTPTAGLQLVVGLVLLLLPLEYHYAKRLAQRKDPT
jgi:hypothetical protein